MLYFQVITINDIYQTQLSEPMNQKRNSQKNYDIDYTNSPKELDGELAKRFTFIGKIGEGSFGTVAAVFDKKRDVKLALKKIKLNKKNDGICTSSLRQIAILRSISHPNIVKIQEVFYEWEDPIIAFTLQYHPMNLHQYLKHKSPLSLVCIQKFTRNICKGLAHLHKKSIMHRDIKPYNLLISTQGILSICDFGQAKLQINRNIQHTADISTMWYRAPEILMGSVVYNQKIDAWAVGCILAQMVLGKPLFKANSELGMLISIFQLLGTPTLTNFPQIKKMPYYSCAYPRFKGQQIQIQGLNSDGLDLLRKLLTVNPKNRMNMEQALLHPFLSFLQELNE